MAEIENKKTKSCFVISRLIAALAISLLMIASSGASAASLTYKIEFKNIIIYVDGTDNLIFYGNEAVSQHFILNKNAADNLRGFVMEFGTVSARNSKADQVADAMVKLGDHYVSMGTILHDDATVERGVQLLIAAASQFGNTDAQFRVGVLCKNGIGIRKDLVLGSRWLNIAADKGHLAAQLVLADMMVSQGQMFRSRGLGWYLIAGHTADEEGYSLDKEKIKTIFAEASEKEKDEAHAFSTAWIAAQ